MSQQAIITLMAITPGIIPPKRVFKLGPEHLSVSIGRASKSVSKGLVSAEDNAWFDNPVMSRDHAELVFDPDDMAILIKDTRSMHGTMLNDQKVPINALQQVKTGDILSFGTEVRRGPSVFPPCCFNIAYEFVPWTSVDIPPFNLRTSADGRAGSRGFRFPDFSDIEDSQDLFEEEEEASQEGDVTPAESPFPKTPTTTVTKHFIKKDPLPQGTTSQGIVAEGLDGPQDTISFAAQGLSSQSTGQVENPINLDDVSSDEANEDETAENEQQDREENDEKSEEDSDKESNDESSDESDDVVGESIYDSDSSDARLAEDNKDESVVIESHNERHYVQPHMFYDNKDIPISSIRSTAFRFPDANTQEGTQEQNNYPVTKDGFSWNKEKTHEPTGNGSIIPPVTPPAALGTSQLGEAGGVDLRLNDVNASLCPSQPPSQLRSISGDEVDLITQKQSVRRQPSPSDAALAKSFKNETPALPSSFGPADQTVNPAYAGNFVATNWNQVKAQSLGDRIGKHEFFQAREINRARAHEEGSQQGDFKQTIHPYNSRSNDSKQGNFLSQVYHHLPQNLYPVDATPFPPTVVPLEKSAQQQQIIFQQRMARENMACQAQMQALAMQQHHMVAQHKAHHLATQQRPSASSNCLGGIAPHPPTIPEPQICPGTYSRATPEPDMTSAAKFNQSKLMIAAQRASSKPSRSSVRIDDIVDRSVVNSTASPLKRKASEISEVVEEEIRVWASKDSSLAAGNLKSLPDQSAGVSTPNFRDNSLSKDAAVLAQEIPSQPATKKLKRFAENVAYFALGGIALSAGLFSVLVNTAPDFLDG